MNESQRAAAERLAEGPRTSGELWGRAVIALLRELGAESVIGSDDFHQSIHRRMRTMDPILGDGDPAFPRDHAHDGHNGMSMRDYYAGKAMAAILSTMHQGIRPCDVGLMAKDAFAVADAMLKARVS